MPFTVERYQSILDASLDAIACVDASGRVADWNARATMMFGYSGEQMAGRRLAPRILAAEDADRLKQTIAHYRATAGDSAIGKRMAMRGRHRNGDEFPIELTLTPIDIGGELYFAVFIRDYSSQQTLTGRRERQALEAQLAQHATLWTARAETFEEAVRNCLEVMCQITGWPLGHAWIPDRRRQRLITRGIWHGIDEQRDGDFVEAVGRISFQRGEGLPGRVWDRGEAEWIRDISADPSFLRSELGARLGVRGAFAFPVTADDEVEAVLEFFSREELTPDPQLLLLVGGMGSELGRLLERRRWDEQRRRLAAIVDSSSDAIIAKSLDGTIISWNEGARRMYGYTAEEAIGQTASIILPPGVREEEVEIQGAVQSGRRLVQFETRRRNRHGRLLDVSLTVSPLKDSRGRIVGSSTIERDVTRQKERERELEQARRDAESSLRAKSEFLANISHELRTPMNAIIGMIELALGENLSPLTRDYLETAADSSRVMLSLVNDLLDFSRMEAGKLELSSEPFSVRRMLDEAMRALSLRAYERGLELTGQVNTDVPDRLEGDGRRLRQVIMNLAGNGIKFTEQGEVSVRIAVAAREGDDVTLWISVTDTGIGISPEDRRRIFKPFSQADASSTRKHSGAGLGLTICRELIHRMGGSIDVESEPGEGSTFTCTARFKALGEPSGDDAARVRELRGLPVLVIDDNATNRRILTETLAGWSLNPETAASAAEALRKVREARERGEPYSLLVVDALMPDVDGFALIQSLKTSEQPEAHTVLMMSSADRQTFEDRCENLDVEAFIEKPVSESILLDAVMTALGGPQTDDEAVRRIDVTPRTLRVLIVEDTPANQKVVRAILQKRGHEVEVAHNGREAIERHCREDFDVILMDVQMPTMDGYQATGIIRELEDAAKASVPIIAMTAHALAGDRVRCLQAGMDSYISKPVDAQELIRLVERLASRTSQRSSESSAMPSTDPTTSAEAAPPVPDETRSPDPEVLSLEGPLRRMGGDRELLRDMAGFLVDDAPRLFRTIHDALERDDLPEAGRAAHSLKGLAANFDAARARDAALRVEEAAGRTDASEAERLLSPLRSAFEELVETLQRVVLDAPDE